MLKYKSIKNKWVYGIVIILFLSVLLVGCWGGRPPRPPRVLADEIVEIQKDINEGVSGIKVVVPDIDEPPRATVVGGVDKIEGASQRLNGVRENLHKIQDEQIREETLRSSAIYLKLIVMFLVCGGIFIVLWKVLRSSQFGLAALGCWGAALSIRMFERYADILVMLGLLMLVGYLIYEAYLLIRKERTNVELVESVDLVEKCKPLGEDRWRILKTFHCDSTKKEIRRIKDEHRITGDSEDDSGY